MSRQSRLEKVGHSQTDLLLGLLPYPEKTGKNKFESMIFIKQNWPGNETVSHKGLIPIFVHHFQIFRPSALHRLLDVGDDVDEAVHGVSDGVDEPDEVDDPEGDHVPDGTGEEEGGLHFDVELRGRKGLFEGKLAQLLGISNWNECHTRNLLH